jgi:hypothetical protein
MSSAIDALRLLEIKKSLNKLPKPARVKTYTGQAALEALSKELKTLSKKGYNPKEIAEILKKEGLSASAAKVKRVLAGDAGPQGKKHEAGSDVAAQKAEEEAEPVVKASPAPSKSKSTFKSPPPAKHRLVGARAKSNGRSARL